MNKYQIEFLKNVVINYKCKELLETDKRLWKEDWRYKGHAFGPKRSEVLEVCEPSSVDFVGDSILRNQYINESDEGFFQIKGDGIDNVLFGSKKANKIGNNIYEIPFNFKKPIKSFVIKANDNIVDPLEIKIKATPYVYSKEELSLLSALNMDIQIKTGEHLLNVYYKLLEKDAKAFATLAIASTNYQNNRPIMDSDLMTIGEYYPEHGKHFIFIDHLADNVYYVKITQTHNNKVIGPTPWYKIQVESKRGGGDGRMIVTN